MRYGSVCSGIEAVTVAWHGLGLEPAWFSEIDPFPCAVLAHHYPQVENLGDMTTVAARVLAGEVEAPDILVGGTPCQSFSVAGLRRGLADDRGNLALAFVELADAVDSRRRTLGRPPAWVLWENVPGALTVDGGLAFGSILGGLVGSDDAIPARAGWARAGVVSGPSRRAAWRHLDARYHGLAQRRDRLFVLARDRSTGWAAPEALLPLVPRSGWNPAPRRGEGSEASGVAADGATGAGVEESGGIPELSYCISGGPGGNQFGTGRGGQDTFIPELVGALACNRGPNSHDAGNLTCNQGVVSGHVLPEGAEVRRLTPVECARLQGFPDEYLDLPGANDSKKYRALGNSMAVPVMAYIGRRILAVEGRA